MRYISYSAFGPPLYFWGALVNVYLAKIFYPGWTVAVYTDFPPLQRELLTAAGAIVLPWDTPKGRGGSFWRFLAGDLPDCERVIYRDADSRLDAREAGFVADWIDSRLRAHSLHDWRGHTNPWLAGMMGLTGDEAAKLADAARSWAADGRSMEVYGDDERFLAETLIDLDRRNLCFRQSSARIPPPHRPIPAPTGVQYIGMQIRQPTIIQMGRAGDILNLLPAAMYFGGAKIISRPEYRNVANTASYVERYQSTRQLNEASLVVSDLQNSNVPFTMGMLDRICVTQAFGDMHKHERCSTFAQQEWHSLGIAHLFDKLPLIIDLRNRQREQVLVDIAHRDRSKPLILCNATGVSSRYPHGNLILRQLYERWGTSCEIFDLGELKAALLTDLLGLYDAAAVLVTIDTATLHLAGASRVPVVYFQPTGWTASPPRGNCIHVQSYTDTSSARMHAAIESALEAKGHSCAF